MDRSSRFPLTISVLAFLCLAAPAALVGQTPAAETTAASDAAKKRPRPISNEVAAALGMPKYNPPKPVAPQPEVDEEDLPDLRDADKPRNKIVRLPDYVVREKKPAVFSESDVRDKKAYAQQRFGGLNLSPGNAAVAGELLWQEDRLKSKAEFADLARTGSVGDAETARYYKKLQNDTYQRSPDTTYQAWPTAAERAGR